MTDLFAPLSLLHGPPMRNRFMLAPLTNQQSDLDGTPSGHDQDWIRQIAAGGYGLVQTGAATVEASGIAYRRQLGIHSDDHVPGLREMATSIRAGGGLSAVQLHHAGHRAAPELGGVPACASTLTTSEVQRIRDSFVTAAVRAERAGFDGVALHGAFGWVLSEFLSPLLNTRTDRYGGNPENRARLTYEVIDGIRRATGPEFQIGWRLSVERYGLQLEELAEITADVLDRELVDYLDLALWDSAQIVRDGRYRGRTMLSVFAELPRRGVRVGVAGRVGSSRRAEELLDEGCDFVLIGRAAILRRDFPLSAQEPLPELPVSAEFLRGGGLSERFIQHMRRWPYFVSDDREDRP